MRYYTMSSDTVSERLYEPYAIYLDPDGATLKVIGYDHKSGEIRPFSIDHIQSLRLTREHFTRPADFALPEYLSEHCFNGIHGPPVTGRLRATGVTARIFAERQFHPSQRIIVEEPPAPKATTIEMRVAGGRGLLRFVMSWLPDVEVLSPPELRAEVESVLRQSLTPAQEK
jgi:predicted DNA-binding transcriptional regulator YafY